MTTEAENEFLTSIGPGPPTGALLRQYRIPTCLSAELVADRDPLWLVLPGEKPFAFRDRVRKIGIFDHRCSRIAAPRHSSAASRKASCAAQITTENSTPRALASICRTCPATMTSRSTSRRVYAAAERDGLIWSARTN